MLPLGSYGAFFAAPGLPRDQLGVFQDFHQMNPLSGTRCGVLILSSSVARALVAFWSSRSPTCWEGDPQMVPCLFLRRMVSSHLGAQRTVMRGRDYTELRVLSRIPVFLITVSSGRGRSAVYLCGEEASHCLGVLEKGRTHHTGGNTTHSHPPL